MGRRGLKTPPNLLEIGNIFRNGRRRFQVRPCRHAVEYGAVIIGFHGTKILCFAGMAAYQAKKSSRSAGLKLSYASPAQKRMSASVGTKIRRYIPCESANAKKVVLYAQHPLWKDSSYNLYKRIDIEFFLL